MSSSEYDAITAAGAVSYGAGIGVLVAYPNAVGVYRIYSGINGVKVSTVLLDAIKNAGMTPLPTGIAAPLVPVTSQYYTANRISRLGNAATIDAANSIASQYGWRASSIGMDLSGISGLPQNTFTLPSGATFRPDLSYQTFSFWSGSTIHLDEVKAVSRLGGTRTIQQVAQYGQAISEVNAASSGMRVLGSALRGGGPLLGLVGVAADGYSTYNTVTQQLAAGQNYAANLSVAQLIGRQGGQFALGAAGGVAGAALVGATLGAEGGALAGTVAPGIGNVIGAVGGALAGGLVGAIGGEAAVTALYASIYGSSPNNSAIDLSNAMGPSPNSGGLRAVPNSTIVHNDGQIYTGTEYFDAAGNGVAFTPNPGQSGTAQLPDGTMVPLDGSATIYFGQGTPDGSGQQWAAPWFARSSSEPIVPIQLENGLAPSGVDASPLSPAAINLPGTGADGTWQSQSEALSFVFGDGRRGDDTTGWSAGLTNIGNLLNPGQGPALVAIQGAETIETIKNAKDAAAEAALAAQQAANIQAYDQALAAQAAAADSTTGVGRSSLSGSILNVGNIALSNGVGGYTYPFNEQTYEPWHIVVDVSTDGGATWSSSTSTNIGGIQWTFDLTSSEGGSLPPINLNGGGLGDGGDLALGGDAIAPVVLDLSGDGINITSLTSSSTFVDVTGDGQKNRTAWAGAGNGVLMLNLSGSGVDNPMSFDFTRWDPTATTDMQALKDVFDTNHDGMLDAGDADWSAFGVQVTNADGTTTFETLDQLGITSINLTTDNVAQVMPDGSQIAGETTYTRTDGTTGVAADVSFAYDVNGYATQQTTTLNTDGSTTIDVQAFNVDGVLANETISTTSANGMMRTVRFDDNGNGVIDRITTDATVINADGSRTETLSDFNAIGTLVDRTITVTSADESNVSITRDLDGNGTIDQTEQHVRNSDGSTTVTTSDLSANGSLEDRTVVNTSADGLTTISTFDLDGDGVVDPRRASVTVVGADDSRTTTVYDYSPNGTMLGWINTVTSADGSSKTTWSDLNGDGAADIVSASTIVRGTDGSSVTIQIDYAGNATALDETITTLSADGLSKTTQVDLDYNGTFDLVTTDVTVHNDDGSETETVTERNADGSLRNQTITTWSSGSAARTVQTDSRGNGLFDHVETVTVAVDGGSIDTVSDFNPDGSLKDRTVSTTSADGLTTSIAEDVDGDGRADITQTHTQTAGGGGTVVTSVERAADGTLLAEQVVTTSADGHSITTQIDSTGTGGIDTTRTDVTVTNADGSTTETVADRSTSGTLLDQTVTTISADRQTAVVDTDTTGNGSFDQTQTVVTNPDGSVTTTVADFNPDGSLRNRTITTKSANGLTVTEQSDATGSGRFDVSRSDTTVLNADGSSTETVADFNADGSLRDRTVTATSADGLAITTQQDSAGSGTFDFVKTDVTTLNSDGSRVETVSEFDANGVLHTRVVTTTSANGFSVIQQQDSTGSDTFDQTRTDEITLSADGSRVETVTNFSANGSVEGQVITTTDADSENSSTSTITAGSDRVETVGIAADGSKVDTVTDQNPDGSLKDQTVTTTSADGLSVTTQRDSTGAGSFDLTRTDVTVLDADGSRTETVIDRSGDGSLLDESIETVSGNGLSVTGRSDTTGAGVFDTTSTDVTVLDADGSTTETVTDRNADGSLRDQSITTTSADRRSVTVNIDSTGNGRFDQTQTTVTNADGGVVKTVADFSADGTLEDRTVTTTSANGLATTAQVDDTGSGTFAATHSDATVLNADGSRTETVSDFYADGSLADRTVTTTSANGLSITTQQDHTGSGTFDTMRTDVTVLNADGSRTETVIDSGRSSDETIVTTSADGLTVYTSWWRVAGVADGTRGDVTVLNVDGSKTETVMDYNTDGSLRGETTTSTSADGSAVTVTRTDPDVLVYGNQHVYETSTTVLEADGSHVSTTADYEQHSNGFMLDEKVVTTSADGLSVTTQWDTNGDGTFDETRTDVTVLNADGGRTETVTSFDASGNAIDRVTATTSADKLSKTVQWDDTGTSSASMTETDVTTPNADGSQVETVTDLDTNGTLIARTTTTTSADGNTVTLERMLGDGSRGVQVEQKNANGSVVTTSSDYGANGALLDQSIVTLGVDGLSRTTQRDTTGSGTLTTTRTDTSTPNADGSHTETVTDLTASGELQDRTVTTVSADGLSTTEQYDLTGAGAVTETRADAKTVNADGSTSETVTYTDASGAMTSQYVEDVSSDGLSIEKRWDTTGNGTFDQRLDDVTVRNADGSRTETVSSYDASGKLLSWTVTTTSSDNLTSEEHIDTNGDGTFDQGLDTVKLINADGSTTTTMTDWPSSLIVGSELDQQVTTTSADGRTTTITRDANGDGTIDQTETTVINADSSTVATITDYNAGHQIEDRSIVTTSVDGLSITTQWDLNGDGSIDRTRSDVTVIDADGSRVETITDLNSDGSLYQKGVLMTSADGRTQTQLEDTTGAGFYNHTMVTITAADGSTTTVADDFSAADVVSDESVTAISADGLTKTVQTDTSGRYTFNERTVTTKAIDGRELTTETDYDATGAVDGRKLTTLSADGRSEIIDVDSTNSGWYDSTETLTTSIDGVTSGILTALEQDGYVDYTITAVSSASGLANLVQAASHGFSDVEITGDANQITPAANSSKITGIRVTGNRNVVIDTLSNSNATANGTGNTIVFSGSNNVLYSDNGVNTLAQGYAARFGNTLIDQSGRSVAMYASGNIEMQSGLVSGEGGTDTLVGFSRAGVSGYYETIVGASAGHEVLIVAGQLDTISAQGAGNTLISRGGDDLIESTGVGDTFLVDSYASVLLANSNWDFMQAEATASDNTLIANAGGNTLVAEAGSSGNTLVGNIGDNTLLAAAGSVGNVLISNGLGNAIEAAGAEALLYTGVDDMTINLATGRATATGQPNFDSLVGITDVAIVGTGQTVIGGGAQEEVMLGVPQDANDGYGTEWSWMISGTAVSGEYQISGSERGSRTSQSTDQIVSINAVKIVGDNQTLATSVAGMTLQASDGKFAIGDTLLAQAANDVLDGRGAGTLITINVASQRPFEGYMGETLFAQGNHDTLIASDFLDDYGMNLAEEMISNLAGNTLIAGSARDRVSYSGSDVVVDLGLGTAMVSGQASGDTLIGIGNVAFSGAGDTLIAGVGTETLSGGTGTDFVFDAASIQAFISNFDLASDRIDFGNQSSVLLISEATENYQPGLLLNYGSDTLFLSDLNVANFTQAADLSGASSISFAGMAAGITVNLASASHGGDLHVENVIGSASGNNILTGDANANVLTGGAGDDTLTSGGGSDTLRGGGGQDTYVIGVPSGHDVIFNGEPGNSGPSGELILDASLNSSNLWFSESGSDLVVRGLGSSNETTIKGWFSNPYRQLLVISSGDQAIDTSAIDALVQAMADYARANPDFNPATAAAMPADAALAAKIASQWLTNTLTGTSADNTLDLGAVGYGTLIGAGGNDTYMFAPGYGQDVIINGTTASTAPTGQLTLGAGINLGDLWLTQRGEDLVVQILGMTDAAVVTNWFADAGAQLTELVMPDGTQLATDAITALAQAMSAYAVSHPDFDPSTTVTGMPLDPELLAALNLAWTRTLSATGAGQTLENVYGDGTLFASQAGADTLVAGMGNPLLVSNTNGNTLIGGLGGVAYYPEYGSYAADNETVNLATGTAGVNGSITHDTLIGITVAMEGGSHSTLIGGSGNETLIGMGSQDVEIAGDGTTTLLSYARDGDESYATLIAGTGDDFLLSEDQDSTLLAGSGNDVMIGWGSGDIVRGGIGTDTLEVGGHSTAIAGSGMTTLMAYDGGVLLGGTGNDVLMVIDAFLGEASNTLIAGTGRDTLTSDGVGDTLYAAMAHDTLISNGENNLLSTHAASTLISIGQSDTLFDDFNGATLIGTGSAGAIVGVTENGSIVDLLPGVESGDVLIGINVAEAFGQNDYLQGGDGASTLIGDLQNTQLYGRNVLTQAYYKSDNLVVDLSANLAYYKPNSYYRDHLSGISNATVVGDYETLIGGSGSGTLTTSGFESTLIAGGGPTVAGFFDDSLIVNLGTDWAGWSGFSDNYMLIGIRAAEVSGKLDTIVAGTGSDTLVATGVNDVLIGNLSNSTLESAGGQNASVEYFGVSNLVVDLVHGTANVAGASLSDTLIGISEALLEGANDTLIGTDGNTTLFDAYGHATLVNAVVPIAGIDGYDTLISDVRGNTLMAGNEPTVLLYADSNLTIDLGAGFAHVNGGSATDTLIGIDDVAAGGMWQGPATNDTLIAGNTGTTLTVYGANSTLIGGSGDDVMAALVGTGNTLIGGGGINTLDYSNAVAGNWVIDLATERIYQSRFDVTDVISDFQNAIGSGAGDSTLIGGAGTSTLTALYGGNTLVAGAGATTMINDSVNYQSSIYQYGAGDGPAVIVNGEASATPTNELEFGAGIDCNDLWFERSGNDLRIDVLGTHGVVTVDGWFADDGNQLTDITAGGLTIDHQLSQLVQAMAGYATAHPGFDPGLATQMPADTTLQTAIAASWHA